ncbi:protein Bouncer-like [Paramormyrops kingsleyae]|uniref:Prostate stem cell antigen-like n=1 Tax=Paramormyrops kingsleyae TaxID=1676925 RepID=A0A3B3SJV0_9TELE|nr:prostate stem cell antigen-like [Paramormyrops kingsleyae]
MSHLLMLLLLLGHVPPVDPLSCYICMFPTITPADCLFTQDCAKGQQCLSSMAIGTQGVFRVVLYEKGCAITSQCGLSGEKFASGLNFTYSNVCCETDLCNADSTSSRPRPPFFSPLLTLVLVLL